MRAHPARARVFLLVGLLSACGGRSERHDPTRGERLPCEEPIVFPDPLVDAAVRKVGALTADQSIALTDVEGLRYLYVIGAKSLAGLECLTNLESLTAREGPLEDIGPLAGLRKLESVDLSANTITDLSPFTGHTELRSIDITRNAVRDLGPLSSSTIINYLYFDFNQVTLLEPLAGIPVGILYGTNNRISDLSPLATMKTYLREIALSYNPIYDLSPLAALSQLDTLRLDSADLDDLSPLRANGLLRVLEVDSNRIRDLSPLSASIALHVLHARHNLIDSLEGLTLPEPRCGGALELVGNPLDAEDVDALCAARWVVRYGDPLQPDQCNADCLP